MNMSGGVLMVNGQKIGEIKDIELEAGPEVPVKICSSAEITGTIHIKPRAFYSLIAGVYVSNNYMKMHGGVMERKVQYRKIRRKHHG